MIEVNPHIPVDPQVVHETLINDHTSRYIRRVHASLVAYPAPYDPDNPVCDYDRTWWPAEPNKHSVPIGTFILGRMHGMNRRAVDRQFVAPFVQKADDIAAALQEFPVMLINGHSPDLQAALSLLAGSMGIAEATGTSDKQQAIEDMIRISHGVATRNMVPIMLGRPWLPKPKKSFLELQQLVVNPHFSFQRTKTMAESSLDENFVKPYNSKLARECIEAAKRPTGHPLGFRTFWSLAPGAAPDTKIKDETGKKARVTAEVGRGTIALVSRTRCALLPVYTSFGKGKRPTVISLGEIIHPDNVGRDTLPNMMADLAEFRRMNGESAYYEAEDEAQQLLSLIKP